MSLPLYIKCVLKDRQVASIVPTFRNTVRRTIGGLEYHRDLRVVEYGPGSGAFTKHILGRLSPQSELFAFETNLDFVMRLRRTIRDPRFTVFAESAELVTERVGNGSVDYVVSGIPFSLIPWEVRRAIIRASWEVLKPAGKLITYQMFPPTARKDVHLLPLVEELFEVEEVEYELLNIPPLRVYRGRKRPAQ